MVPHHGILLAVDIITTSFGDIVGKVCNCLLEKGALTIQDLARFTKLKPSQLKNSLLVLIQHNCVQAFTRSTDDDSSATQRVLTEYVALFDNILHRLRFSKFLKLIREKFDSQCENIMRILLEHGRLTFDQLMTRGVWISNEEVLDGSDAKDSVRANVVKLAQAHFLERCPNPNPSIVSSPDTNPKKKFARGVKAMEEIVTDEQLAVAAAVCSDSQRFYFPIQGVGASEVMEDEQPSATVGQKRKHVAFEMDAETMASVCEKEVLWHANFDEFIRCLRNKACVGSIRRRLDVSAGTILEAVLEATRLSEENVKIERTAPLSIDAILQAVREHPEGLAMTREHVRAALDQIGLVESIVLKRHGRDSYRIFRLLSMKGCSFDVKEVADYALIETKKAAEYLHKLSKDHYLHMESIKHPQGQSQWLCLWKVNKNIVWEHVLDDMYHASVNLSRRLAFEIEQERENSSSRTKVQLRWYMLRCCLEVH
ncbi:DNA-directed RNA polymerase III subunit [Nymphaea thermarum]|nr:DNA-directed RNA polymerase III subunit [Nymphaea thermarum]